MTLKIVCFEDNQQHQEMLMRSFDNHEATFKFFGVADWHVSSTFAQTIAQFNPDIVIVDLMNDATGDTTLGYRVIRDLKQTTETQQFPVIAWSRLFRNSQEGRQYMQRAEGFGAIPLQKSLDVPTPAERFLEAAHLI